MRELGPRRREVNAEHRGSSARQRRLARRRTSLLSAAAGTIALCLVGGGVALAVGRSDAVTYRTAVASLGTVEQTVDAVGTVSSATRYDTAFSVAGTVASVGVAVGDTVAAGDVLASLDPTSVTDAIDEAESALADAEQQLEDDIDSQTATTSTTTSTSTSGTTSGTSASGTSASGSSAASTAASSGAAAGASSAASGATPSAASTPSSSASASPATDAATRAAIADAVTAVTTAQAALLGQYDAAQGALTGSTAAISSSQLACEAFLAVIAEPADGATPAAAETTTDPASEPAVVAAEVPTGDVTGIVVANAALTGDAAIAEATATATATAAATATATTADELVACQDAIGEVLIAQTTVSEAQTTLLALATALDEAVQTAHGLLVTASEASVADSATGSTAGAGAATSTGAGATGSGTTDTGTATTTSGTTGSGAAATSSGTGAATTGSGAAATTSGTGTATTGAGASASGATTSTVATAADLLADQAQIDLAEAELALTQADLAFVDLTSPIAGTVAAVSITAGDAVSASSTTAVITVIGEDGFVVSTTVPLSEIDVLAVDQTAQVTVSSTDVVLTGIVSSIGILNASTSSADPSYTVLVAVDPTEEPLFDGASAQVVITVAGSGDAVTVPSSAVHVDGSTVTVQVLTDGTPRDVEVERGAAGTELTEITSGLEEGDEVVLADLTQPLVSDESTESTGLTGLSEDSTEETVTGRGQFPGGGGQAGVRPGG